METKTVKELREIAKERGLRGYYKLHKAELIDAINAGIQPQPDIKVPALQPTAYEPLKTFNKVISHIKSFTNWLGSFVPESIKRPINEKIGTLWSKISKTKPKLEIAETKPEFKIVESKTAIKGFTKQHTIDGRQGMDAETFLNTVRPLVVNLLERNRGIKFDLILTCIVEQVSILTGDIITKDAYFNSCTEVNLDATDVNELYDIATDKIKESLATYQLHGSNWRFVAIKKLDINTVAYKPLKGSSYIPLPCNLANKKAIINLKNTDDECFKWCVARALNPVNTHPERITKDLRKQAEQLNWKDISFPQP